jgi:uncharacterized protein YbjT (DUF2867 family)
LLVGGAGPVGQASIRHLLDAGHRAAVSPSSPAGSPDREPFRTPRKRTVSEGATF